MIITDYNGLSGGSAAEKHCHSSARSDKLRTGNCTKKDLVKFSVSVILWLKYPATKAPGNHHCRTGFAPSPKSVIIRIKKNEFSKAGKAFYAGNT